MNNQMTNMTDGTREMLLQWEVQNFLYAEADLLDQRRFDEWLMLLSEEIRYWMPVTRNVRRDDMAREYSKEGVDVAWFDEGIKTLRQRVAQLNTGIHWAEEPASRLSHLVTNIRIVDSVCKDDVQDVTVSLRFLVYQNRLEHEVNWFVGKRQDVLRKQDGQWKIFRREVRLDQTVLLGKALTMFF